MRDSKQVKMKRTRLNKELKVKGRTSTQRVNRMKKSVVDAYDGRLGSLKGKTFREKYDHLHRLIGDENTRLRKIEEEKKNE